MIIKNRKVIILLCFIYILLILNREIKLLINYKNIEINNVDDFINKLNKYSIYRESKYILLFDYFDSPVCEDYNAYTIFEYYRNKNICDAYYILNLGTELYKNLLMKNKTKNIIPYENNQSLSNLFPFLLNSKIIVQSYASVDFQQIVSRVNFIKFLYICHAVNYFKKDIIRLQIRAVSKSKQNIILTSPYEYKFYKKLKLYKENSMHKGGLARYDRLKQVKKNEKEKDCILISFTYRSFENSVYEQSLFKKNAIKLLNDKSLNSFLTKKNIEVVFIQHHHDVRRGREIDKNFIFPIKSIKQKFLSYYIEQCSLFITDFSSISFDFMFQNKPVLFYHLDKNDKIHFKEKSYMKIDKKNSIYYNNIFSRHLDVVNKIKYYVNRNFTLEKGLEKKYKTLFYYKSNITQKIVEIINNIIN